MKKEGTVRVDKLNGLTILDVRGQVNKNISESIWEAYNSIDPQTQQNILLRFDEQTFFNSEGIMVIIQLLAKAKENHQKVGITGLSDHFSKVFQMVGIEKLAPIFNTVKGALKLLGGDNTSA